MKNNLIILFLVFSSAILSQKKVIKKIETEFSEIEISTIGLDDFVLENSTSGFIEITLFAENPHEQHILFDVKNDFLQVEFKIHKIQKEETVFRKFIKSGFIHSTRLYSFVLILIASEQSIL